MKPKSFFVLLRRTAVLLVGALVLVLCVVLNANANGSQVLVSNGSSADVNLIKYKRVEYVGQCPGVVLSPGTRQARFSSSSTQRVEDARATYATLLPSASVLAENRQVPQKVEAKRLLWSRRPI